MSARKPYVGEIIPFVSPYDETASFGIRRLTNAEVLAYRDKNSVVRFINREGSEEYIQEKDYPSGTMRHETVLLGLGNWNITDDGAVVAINRDTILGYLKPEELDAIYEKVHEINPILLGKEARKKD